MLKVNDIPEQVIRDIAGAYHRRLESTGTEAHDEKERDFQRACYLRTALEWLAIWINQQAAPAAQSAQPVSDAYKSGGQAVADDVVLPEWDSAADRCEANEGSALDRFIFANEPAGDADHWRYQLQQVIDEVLASAQQQSGGAE